MLRLGLFVCFVVTVSGLEPVEDTRYYVELVNSANTTWTAGYNFENSSVEYLRQFLGTEVNQFQHLLPNFESAGGDEEIDIPTSFDASKKWPKCPHIKHVRDQSACGSCWAVSLASVLTDRLCIASGGTFRAPMSAEYLMSCCAECSNGNGCQGGNHAVAWVFAKTQGIVTGGDYHSHIGCQPYQLQPCGHSADSKRVSCGELLPSVKAPVCENTKCLNPFYKKNTFSKDHKFVKEAYVITNDEKAIQREILQRGPVAAGFVVYADFPSYKSGVYHRMSETAVGGHGVKIIGWGTEGGVDYWLVVNSWNTDWGEKGLFKIRRMTAGVDFEQMITFGVV
uniref:Cathepsin B n=1 Tax=Lygus hesperus TaxID=30085 RepID=A0A146MAS8_LYGHE